MSNATKKDGHYYCDNRRYRACRRTSASEVSLRQHGRMRRILGASRRTCGGYKIRWGVAIAVKAGVSSASEIDLLFKAVIDEFGRIDVVVHTAGVVPMGNIADGDLETFEKVIATNFAERSSL